MSSAPEVPDYSDADRKTAFQCTFATAGVIIGAATAGPAGVVYGAALGAAVGTGVNAMCVQRRKIMIF